MAAAKSTATTSPFVKVDAPPALTRGSKAFDQDLLDALTDSYNTDTWYAVPLEALHARDINHAVSIVRRHAQNLEIGVSVRPDEETGVVSFLGKVKRAYTV